MVADIILISGEFQYITFLWMPLFISTNVKVFDNQFNYAAILIYFTRLDEIITFQFSSQIYNYLIPLASEIIFSILPLFLLIVAKHLEYFLTLTGIRWFFNISSIFF